NCGWRRDAPPSFFVDACLGRPAAGGPRGPTPARSDGPTANSRSARRPTGCVAHQWASVARKDPFFHSGSGGWAHLWVARRTSSGRRWPVTHWGGPENLSRLGWVVVGSETSSPSRFVGWKS